MSSSQPLLDAAGRRRSSATTPGFRVGIAPGNKGQTYPADPPTVDEIVAVMRQAGDNRHGHRLNAVIVVLWRAGLRIHEALSLTETDLDPRRGSILVRHGKNDRRREVGMDAWAWSAIEPWLADRVKLPIGPLFCVIDGPTAAVPGQPAPCGSSFTASLLPVGEVFSPVPPSEGRPCRCATAPRTARPVQRRPAPFPLCPPPEQRPRPCCWSTLGHPTERPVARRQGGPGAAPRPTGLEHRARRCRRM